METSFVVNVPSVGFYKLQIYGLPESAKSSELPGVFNYLINCRKLTQAVFPFPKQYAQWKDGCFMREPGVIPTARGQFASQVGFASWRVFVYMCALIVGMWLLSVMLSLIYIYISLSLIFSYEYCSSHNQHHTVFISLCQQVCVKFGLADIN